MRITTVLTAVNNNPEYTRFIPIFIYMWKKFYPQINVRIIYIGNDLPISLHTFSDNIIVFPPIEGVSTVYTAQTIRILYPALLDENETTVITDMDMLPANKTYFSSLINEIPSNTFLMFRDLRCVSPDQIPICYNAASTSIWKKVFGINSINDIRSFLREKYDLQTDGIHGGHGWYTDQVLLRKHVFSSGVSLLTLNDNGYKRLDIYDHRYNIPLFIEKLKTMSYSDAHLYSHECPWSLHELSLIHI